MNHRSKQHLTLGKAEYAKAARSRYSDSSNLISLLRQCTATASGFIALVILNKRSWHVMVL